MVFCAVVWCSNTYSKENGVHLYSLPSVITNQCDKTRELSTERRGLWLARINRPELVCKTDTRNIKVCNRHFINGKPSRLFENTHYDWAPSLILGYRKRSFESQTIAATVARQTRADDRRKRRLEVDVLPDVRCSGKILRKSSTDVSEDNRRDSQDIPDIVSVGLEKFEISTNEFMMSDEHNLGDCHSECEPVSACQTDLTGKELNERTFNLGCLTKENRNLQNENDVLKADLLELQSSYTAVKAENVSLLKDNIALRSEVSSLRDKLKSSALSQEILENDDAKVKFYTGLPTYTLLTHIFNLVGAKIEHSHRNALPKFTEFLMVMMRLRLGLLEQDLAYRFGVAQSTVSLVCDKWIRMMSARLSPFIIWPERHVLRKTMPECFKEAFGDKVAVIIDCFKMFINRPSSLVTRAETWSQYKHHNTAKYLIGITPQGTVCFISSGWSGRASDKRIILSSGFLEKLIPGDLVLVDRGFDIAEDVGLCRANLAIPAFTKGKSQLSSDEVNETRNIA